MHLNLFLLFWGQEISAHYTQVNMVTHGYHYTHSVTRCVVHFSGDRMGKGFHGSTR